MTDRIILLLSPILTGLAGWIVVLAARYLPGHPHLDQHELFDLFVAGVGLASAQILLWIHGHQNQPAGPS